MKGGRIVTPTKEEYEAEIDGLIDANPELLPTDTEQASFRLGFRQAMIYLCERSPFADCFCGEHSPFALT